MVHYDPANQNSPDSPLVVSGGKPSIDELVNAIESSAVSGKYPEVFLRAATKNDLIYICREEGIDVPGLPGAGDFPVDAPDIDTHPSNESVADEGEAEFAVVATGSTPLQYQWQVSDGGPYTDIPGADEDEYSFTASSADDGNLYRVRVWNSKGAITSTSATLTVT